MPQIITTNKGTYCIATSHVLAIFKKIYFVLCNFKLQLKLHNAYVSSYSYF